MLRKTVIKFVFFLILFCLSLRVVQASEYVLPYPGVMPGNKLYKIKETYDYFYQFWAFGNLSKLKYHQSLADKKLVEAKTLFEYQQYPLAIAALKSSNAHFQFAANCLEKARKEGKIVDNQKKNLENEAEKHREVLTKLFSESPPEFVWRPEKREPQTLLIKQLLEEAVKIRQFN